MSPDSHHDSRERPVYRPSQSGGMDATTRRLAIAAGGIGVVLAALVGGWSLIGHHGGSIPVIEAPSGPERVKPVDPGGLQLMGAEPPPANADAPAGSGPSLAPGPETPDPKALQAELDRAGETATSTTATPARPTPTIPSDPVAPTAPTTISAPTPALAPTPTPAPPPTLAPSPARTAGRVQVQLAAMDTDALAHAEWSRLQRKAPALFAGRTPSVSTAEHAGHTFYRLRTGGFATVADATVFCGRVRAVGGACTIAAF